MQKPSVTYKTYELREFKPGAHICCLYKNKNEHKEILTRYIVNGIKRNHKILYIVDNHTAADIRKYLEEVDLDPDEYISGGQLEFLSSRDAYLKNGIFDPDKMIDLLEKETNKALDNGFIALRLTGEMSWALKGLPGSGRLIEYEAKLNYFIPNHSCQAICQYNINEFKPDILIDVINTHPFIVLGTKVYENFYYIKPKDFLGSEKSRIELEHRIETLVRYKESKIKILQSKEELEKSLSTSEFYKSLMSHDIRNVFQNILIARELILRLLQNHKEIDQIESHLNTIEEQVRRGINLIKNIKMIADLKEYKLGIEKIKVGDILYESIEYIKNSFKQKEINIEVKSDLKQYNVAANNLLREIFDNILINAVLHNRNENVEIKIHISQAEVNGENYIKIEFIDNGVGIPYEMRENIFKPISNGLKTGNGMGIGLSLVKTLIDSYKGRIWVEDRIKGDYTQGTNIIIEIPSHS
ncbi:MAG: hypothetical protein GF329_13195 [Candidatus Lokiarchaeota archaeon]|nr:hypothetical protein [Candidatus Lokiarchaeota archaeon]